jgi:hypothetical protein
MGVLRDERAAGWGVSVVMAATISAPLLSGDGRVGEARSNVEDKYANGYSNCYVYVDEYADGDTHSYVYVDTNSNNDSDVNVYPNMDTNRDDHADVYSD